MTPSVPYASTLGQAGGVAPPLYCAGATEIEKVLDAGMPVVTVSWLDCVVSAGDEIAAVTVTDVCTVPELTTVCTVPSAAELAEAGDRLMPPTLVLSVKLTVTPGFGAPV